MIESFNWLVTNIVNYVLAFITLFLVLTIFSAFLRGLIDYTLQQLYYWRSVYKRVDEMMCFWF